GIDSSALLVTADGDPDVIDQAEAQLAESTRWVLAGENWVAGIYQGGPAVGYEIEALVETISWTMDPGSACQQGEIACPLGPEVGVPPPPPRLVVNDEIDDEAVPFEVVEIEGASLVEADGVSATWIIDGQAFTGWGDPSDPVEIHARGPALVASSIGNYAFLVDPAGDGSESGAVSLRPCCEETNQVEWPIPTGWLVDGLVLIGNFGRGDYRLIVTTRVDNDSVAVGVPINENIFKPQATIPDLEGGIESLPRLNPPGHPWTLPQRNSTGGLSVVEERPDGWYLVEDALGDSRDLFRANYPIISYATDSGNRHIVAVVDGPDGPSTWWI
ncbi:MAG: hypothetical protein GY925_23690, partial [Actinomycetia bacterium]|nr:hypothetical protein [Actinomycetes bacterium]